MGHGSLPKWWAGCQTAARAITRANVRIETLLDVSSRMYGRGSFVDNGRRGGGHLRRLAPISRRAVIARPAGVGPDPFEERLDGGRVTIVIAGRIAGADPAQPGLLPEEPALGLAAAVGGTVAAEVVEEDGVRDAPALERAVDRVAHLLGPAYQP